MNPDQIREHHGFTPTQAADAMAKSPEKRTERESALIAALVAHWNANAPTAAEIDWNDPTARASLLEAIGPAAYNTAAAHQRNDTVIETCEGFDLRTIVSERFGALIAVDRTGHAYRTLEQARAFARDMAGCLFLETEFDFGREMVGGGCEVMSYHAPCKGEEFPPFIWASCLDGGGLPSPTNWHVCVYPGGEAMEDPVLSLRSDECHISLKAAVVAAMATLPHVPTPTSGPSDEGSTDALSDEFQQYCTWQGLPEMSADELIHEDLTPEQRKWVSDFILRWEAVQAREDFESAIAARGER